GVMTTWPDDPWFPDDPPFPGDPRFPEDPRSLEEMLREDTDLDALERDYARAVGELAGDARAEAAAAGRQLRGIHRMWRLQEEAHEQRRAVLVRWLNARSRRCGRQLLESRSLLEVAAEIGPVLRLPAVTAVRRVEQAIGLAGSLPEVLTALEDGVIGGKQAEVVVETWIELLGSELRPPPEPRPPVEAVRQLAEDLLRAAPQSTAAQLRALARRRREELLRNTEEQRHRQALADRRVWVEPGENGMARVCALLDAATAYAARDRLASLARRAGPAGTPGPAGCLPGTDPDRGPGGSERDRRTCAQVQADVLADLLLTGEPPQWPADLRGIRGQVAVTVPALALLAHTTGPGAPPAGLPAAGGCAELAGYGPIPLELAARIAVAAPSWSRVLTDPVTGTVLEYDRATYAVPADLKRRLRHRDETCRFPGCRRSAERCDLDHTVAWAQGGATAAGNLAHLCRHHHLLKHRHGPLGPWTVSHRDRRDPRCPEGVLEWTSPAGRMHVTYPRQYHHPVLTPLRIQTPLSAEPPAGEPSAGPPPPAPGDPGPLDRRDPGPPPPSDDPPPF
ncbi:DUF222 domain-containing protein, partial [Kocuria sp. M1R5S2]|uniref:HNH endonuclease signature motif containing protein n=1 Tax=Kocuria rhizosphaerae TaxID=3376285 RepID=UPI0037B0F3CC